MLWIHGGCYRTGGASNYNASALATRGQVVVVLLNYRRTESDHSNNSI